MIKNLWIFVLVMDVINVINSAINHNGSAFMGWFCAALAAVVIIMNEHNKQNI